FESEYVFRGWQFADAIVTPSVDVAYGDFYAGVWFAVPVENSWAYVNEMDIYGGVSTSVNGILTLDVGACRYAYDEVITSFLNKNNTIEGYIGLSADVLLSPSVYIYYDFDLLVTTLEGSIGHSFGLTDSVSIDVGGSIGYVSPDSGDSYTYYGATADLSYSLNDSSSVGFGLRYSGSTEDLIFGDISDPDTSKSILWYGLSFSTGF
ncbi:MAG: hypothetical protein WC360_05490, partial [Opitutales bacterium]